MKNDYSIELSSDPQNIAAIEPFVEKVKLRFNVSEEVYGNMLITLTEAVTNAIMHGNRADITKIVSIHLLPKSNLLVFKVADQGPGFNFKNLPDPTAPENILSIGGRGVFLMQNLADYIEFSSNGSIVEIHFNI